MYQRPDLPQGMRAARRTSVGVALLALGFSFPQLAGAVPSFARQTELPCSQCHTLSFGPALTAYGRQFKLNGYTFGSGEHPLPLAIMVQGGFSHSDAAPPEPAATHFARNDNLSVDQVSVFLATRLSEHVGMFMQATYSGEDRHFSWDNTDIRYARTLKLFGTDAVAGISLNNNPTVQDLWNSTPAWAFPYITSPLLPASNASPLISGTLAQLVVGATAYTLVHEHYYLEAGAYRGLSNRWLDNVGLYPADNAQVRGAAPYWRAAYQWNAGAHDEHYFSVGTFGLATTLAPDPALPATDRYRDLALDGSYQWTPDGPGAVLVNASLIHESQQLDSTFASGGAAQPHHHLDAAQLDVSYVWRQSLSGALGLFDLRGAHDALLYAPGVFTGSASGSPDTRGYLLQLEGVPFGKAQSWGHPWVNLRVGLQYTGYLAFNGARSNYDGSGRAASGNDSLFLFAWLAF